MGLRALNPAPGASYGPEFTAASYDALVTAMAAADSGDWGQDTTTGRMYRMFKPMFGGGLPIPAELFELAPIYVANASGDSYMLPSDDEAAAAARGVAFSETGNGSATKSAAASAVVNSGNAGSSQLLITPTAWPAASLLLIKITASAGTHIDGIGIYPYTGSKIPRLSLSDGGAGVLALMSGTGTVDPDSVGAETLPIPGWLAFQIDTTPSARLVRAWDMDGVDGDAVVIEYGDTTGDAEAASLYVPYTQSSGATHSLSVEQIHWIELTR